MLIILSVAFTFSAFLPFSKADLDVPYYSWLVGNQADVDAHPIRLTLCQGGGDAADNAMALMLQHADGN